MACSLVAWEAWALVAWALVAWEACRLVAREAWACGPAGSLRVVGSATSPTSGPISAARDVVGSPQAVDSAMSPTSGPISPARGEPERPVSVSAGFPGEAAGGFGANRSGQRAAGDGSGPFGDRSADRPDRGQLSKFLGLPSDGGLHNFAGNQIRGDQRGLSRFPDADLQRRGDDVRRDFRGRDFYNADWYRRHPGTWYPRRWAYGNVWTAATWASLGSWFGYGDADYDYYDYGNNVTYQDNSVYMNGQDMGTADQYYQQAQNLASTGTEAQRRTTRSGCRWAYSP